MRYFIRRPLMAILLLMVFITFTNCNTDVTDYIAGGEIDITETLPEGGSYDINTANLKIASGERSITVSWDAVSDADLSYYILEWTGQGDADATIYTQSVSKELKSYTLKNLYNESYKITVKCASKDHLVSSGVSITASPEFDITAPAAVGKVVAFPLAISASLNWENPKVQEEVKSILVELETYNKILNVILTEI